MSDVTEPRKRRRHSSAKPPQGRVQFRDLQDESLAQRGAEAGAEAGAKAGTEDGTEAAATAAAEVGAQGLSGGRGAAGRVGAVRGGRA